MKANSIRGLLRITFLITRRQQKAPQVHLMAISDGPILDCYFETLEGKHPKFGGHYKAGLINTPGFVSRPTNKYCDWLTRITREEMSFSKIPDKLA